MKEQTTAMRAQALFRQAGAAEPLSPVQLDSVWKKTAARLASGRAVAKWVGLGAVVCMLAASVITASKPPSASPPAAVEVPKPPPPPIETEALPLPPALPAQVRPGPRALARVPPPVDVEDPLLAESRLLARAVSELREQQDPAAALATLDEYATRFRQGVLRNEATLTRVEALVSAKKRTEARQLLQSMELGATPRGGELRVLLGELLLEADQGDQARAQFEAALAGPLVSNAEERAMFGLATCSDEAAAFERYLERFPHGRFSEAARARLGRE